MHELKLTEINIYPIKSLGGISLKSALTERRGLQHDRRWLLINEENRFLTQREIPEMALIACKMADGCFEMYSKINPSISIQIPFEIKGSNELEVVIWNDRCAALHWQDDADAWFSAMLKQPCRLVYMPDSTERHVDPDYATDNDITSFSDGYPYLIIGEASLADLNSRLKEKVLMNRFRPNFVFSGGAAFEEDHWELFRIGSTDFKSAKLCGRCMITTIDQESAKANKEPLATLASYRKSNNRILFGQNLLIEKMGSVQVGDYIIFDK